MKSWFEKYFGTVAGGVNMLQSLENLPVKKLEKLLDLIRGRASQSRLFFMGNGGSFDNARHMAQLCRLDGIAAKTPGESDDYFLTTAAKGYDQIFAEGLKQDGIRAGDIVVGISGSGNSENIVLALELAKQVGATPFCMGGRDGGKMRLVCGDDLSAIAINECMEAIEDLHMLMLVIVLDAIRVGDSIESAHGRYISKMRAFLSDSNLSGIAKIGEGILKTVKSGRYTFVLGLGLGANHFRADMGRGATNTIPIRGVATPEFFSTNSAQATANDDGSHFILIDGLVKYSPEPSDFAILCETRPGDPTYSLCRDYLIEKGVPFVTLGHSDVDISMFCDAEKEFLIAMTGHACGQTIRTQLQQEFAVRPVDMPVTFPNKQKKMGAEQTKLVEAQARSAGKISEKEVLVFCYGKVYAATAPSDRCFY